MSLKDFPVEQAVLIWSEALGEWELFHAGTKSQCLSQVSRYLFKGGDLSDLKFFSFDPGDDLSGSCQPPLDADKILSRSKD